MALFGPGKEAMTYVQNIASQKLSSHPYLNVLMDALSTIVNEDTNQWLTKCQSFYDSRHRTVIVGPDLFQINWVDFCTKPESATSLSEDIHGSIGFAYTNDGYRPLHAAKIGEVVVPISDVVRIWAEIIRTEMIKLFPDFEFQPLRSVYHSGIDNPDNEWYFDYIVPALEWKDWF